jgi:hypothetical protein
MRKSRDCLYLCLNMISELFVSIIRYLCSIVLIATSWYHILHLRDRVLRQDSVQEM